VLGELFKLTQLEVCCGEYKTRASGVVGTRMPSELIDEVAKQGVGEFHTALTQDFYMGAKSPRRRAARVLEIIGRPDPAVLITEVTGQEKPMSTP
jgi:hypothetical protein